ncbi:Acetyl-CoA acetyltransferase (fragment) [uncultured Desulfobacterium sp.]|uniref:Acetyl-CoA acetyltransferase n=1 Tax=uncultured Desulfobacterium sp. TaxID=201089 RepID=A0A445MU21_9BACT
MKDVVIVSACRTAIGTFGGALRDFGPEKMACITMKEAIKRAGIEPGIIDDVRFGCCVEPIDALNIARVSAIMAGIPEHVPAVTINRVCISAMDAVISGMAMIQADMADIILAGGVEQMSGIPFIAPRARLGDAPGRRCPGGRPDSRPVLRVV